MNKRLSAAAATVIFTMLALCLAGCGKPILREDKSISPAPFPPTIGETQDRSWRAVRFRIGWPLNKPPDWSMDLLLADRVIRPVLAEHQNRIPLWRFHRRATRDAAGHRFSFIFYATGPLAENIFFDVLNNRVLNGMLAAKTIEGVKTDDIRFPARSAVEATSDPAWPIELQKAWPAYIMGVSAAWMTLIRQHVQGREPEYARPEDTQIDDLLNLYRNVNDSIDKIWIKDGQHAFLHHLNAIFGYEPVYIRNMMKF